MRLPSLFVPPPTSSNAVPTTYFLSCPIAVRPAMRRPATRIDDLRILVWLRNNDDVSGSQLHVLAEILPFDDLRIVEAIQRAVFTAVPDDHNFGKIGKLLETSREGDRLQDTNW